MPRIRHWVCIKGLKQDARHWRGLPQRLAQATGGRAVALDLPGAGALAGVRVPSSVDGMVDLMRAQWLEQRGEDDGAWGLLGLSLGGMAVLSWASRFPQDVAGVVVGNSSAANVSPPWKRIRADRWGALARAALPMDPIARELHVVGLTTSRLVRHDDRLRVAREHARWQSERGFTRGALVGQLRAASGYRAPDRLDVPALVLVGEGDTFVDPSCGHGLAARLEADKAVHPTAGHDLSLDAPGWLVRTVASWASS